jgi:hypothetical protein
MEFGSVEMNNRQHGQPKSAIPAWRLSYGNYFKIANCK